jgi:hypothetical protein
LLYPQPKATNPFAQQHGLDKIFTVLYSGNIGRLHDIETIAEAILPTAAISPSSLSLSAMAPSAPSSPTTWKTTT